MNRRSFLSLIPGLSALQFVGEVIAQNGQPGGNGSPVAKTHRQGVGELGTTHAPGAPDLCPLCEKPLSTANAYTKTGYCYHSSLLYLYRERPLPTLRTYRAQLLRRREMEGRFASVHMGYHEGEPVLAFHPRHAHHAAKINEINRMLARVEEALK